MVLYVHIFNNSSPLLKNTLGLPSLSPCLLLRGKTGNRISVATIILDNLPI